MRIFISALLLTISIPSFADHFSYSIGDTKVYVSNVDQQEQGPRHHRHHSQPEYSYYWEQYRGYIPSNAIAGGEERGRELLICQSRYMDGMHPGKVVDGRCNITYGGQEMLTSEFNLLLGNNFEWVHEPNSSNAVIGGEEHGMPLYICQARYAHSWHPGKVVDGKCNIGFDGREMQMTDYNVLVSRR